MESGARTGPALYRGNGYSPSERSDLDAPPLRAVCNKTLPVFPTAGFAARAILGAWTPSSTARSSRVRTLPGKRILLLSECEGGS
jgi:hypothetical protein